MHVPSSSVGLIDEGWRLAMRLWKRSMGVLLILALAGASCRSDAPTAPTSVFAGTWSGVMMDATALQGSLTFRINRAAIGNTGTWSSTLAGLTVTGTLTALSVTQSGGVRHSVLAGCPGGGYLVFTVTFAGSRMTGSYDALSCTGFSGGTIDLTKQ
jgi:hypothetical protein